jgi:hypothetical protein
VLLLALLAPILLAEQTPVAQQSAKPESRPESRQASLSKGDSAVGHEPKGLELSPAGQRARGAEPAAPGMYLSNNIHIRGAHEAASLRL